jgi:alanine racemase
MGREWTFRDVCFAAQGELHGNPEVPVSTLAFDSRRLIPTPSTLFVALPGNQHDGHRYIDELYGQGIRAFLVSRLPEPDRCPEAGFCLVGDTLEGLQKLAAERRSRFPGQVAAITGSNGKTIVKEWIYQLMSGPFQLHRSPKSFNSQLGVSLSVWMIGDHHDLAVIEAGISQPGEMERLERIISPSIGLFTNLGTAHQENFDSIEEKLQEKLKLFRHCRKVIFRMDQEGNGLSTHMKGTGAVLVSWCLAGDATYIYRPGRDVPGGTGLNAITPSGSFPVCLPFRDQASVENALHALTFALEMGLPADLAVKRVWSLEPVSMRLEILRGILGTTLINDAYNSDTAGLGAALELLNQHDRLQGKVLILSDLLQSGLEEGRLYRDIAGLAASHGIRRIVGIGPAMIRQQKAFPAGTLFFPDTDEFLQRMDRTLFRDSTILIKGSRRFGFERITRELQLKSHQTLLEIDLNAMVSNLNYYRSLLGKGVKVMVMVKALTYGSGNIEIANLLQFHKVDYLAVAFIDEGIELRKAGIHLPIMVLNPDPSGFSQMLEYSLEPEVYGFRGLESLLGTLAYREISRYPIHLKVDSGMHRLGFQEEETEALIPLLGRPEINVNSVFTHLAASDEPEHDAFSLLQIDRFERITARISEALDYKFDRHILNSAGIERFSGSQFEMVRLGIGLHGIGTGKSLVPASTYRTMISQVRKVKKGETVGYSRSGRTLSDTMVATLPVGYADGIDRRLGNGSGRVWIKGVRVPTIGNVCMDMTMVDVSGLDVAEGDEVELFGKNITVSEVARMAGTIPYEILTSIPERVKRIYLQE